MTYYVPWAKARGSTPIEFWTEEVRSGSARGIRERVRYLDKKGKEQVCTCWVKWGTSPQE